MMEKEKEVDITVQGVGSPVPIQSVGGKAGPTGPSANDCGSSLVVNQAEGIEIATDSKSGSRQRGSNPGTKEF